MASVSEPAPPPEAEERCAACGTVIPRLGSYCPACGAVKPSLRYAGLPSPGNRRLPNYGTTYYAPRKRTDWRRIIKALGVIVMITYLIQFVAQVVTLVWGAKLVVPDILDSWAGFSLYVILPTVIELFEISDYALVVYYFLLIAAIIASCLWIFLTSFSDFKREARMTADSRRHSPLFDTLGLLFATLFFSVMVALIVAPTSDEVPSTMDLSESLLLLANASVWEELVTRVLLIGVPLLVWGLLRSSHKKLRSYFFGGGFSMNLPEVTLVLVSSVIFGFAHYDGGWGAWKIVPTTVAGVAFGYLFLRHGLAAAVMMHFATDYLSLPLEAFYSFGLEVVTGLGILLWVAFGSVFFVYYTTRVAEYLTGRRYFETGASPSMPMAQAPYGYPSPYYRAPADVQYWQQTAEGTQPIPPTAYRQASAHNDSIVGGYVCPACGNTEARWVDGRFQCLRCGNLS